MKVKLLRPAARKPDKATKDSAGYDIYTPEPITLKPGHRQSVKTGFAIAIYPGWCGQIASRSGLYARYNIIAFPGVIDADFRDEVKVLIENEGDTTYEFEVGDRIAQIIFYQVAVNELESVDQLSETDRDKGGFGHSGR